MGPSVTRSSRPSGSGRSVPGRQRLAADRWAVRRSARGVVDLELKENGALAWTVARGSWADPQFSARELWVSDAQGRRMLDRGPGLDTQSLTLSGSTLTWVNDGQTRSATLN
jgi:hypothetical protein